MHVWIIGIAAWDQTSCLSKSGLISASQEEDENKQFILRQSPHSGLDSSSPSSVNWPQLDMKKPLQGGRRKAEVFLVRRDLDAPISLKLKCGEEAGQAVKKRKRAKVSLSQQTKNSAVILNCFS